MRVTAGHLVGLRRGRRGGGGAPARAVDICRSAGMRLVGPNCLGVLNTAHDVRLNATFAPHQATLGRVGFMSQSGGLGIAIIEAAGRLGVGLSSFVSVGNKADLSGNDLLQYWEQDDGHRRGAAVPGVVRKRAQVRPCRAPRGAPEADRGRQERPLRRRRASCLLAHRGDALRLGRDRGCPLRAGGRDPHRHDARAVRRGDAAGRAARAAGRPRGDRDQRGRTGDPLRGRLPGLRRGGARASGRRARRNWPRSCPTRRPWAIRST